MTVYLAWGLAAFLLFSLILSLCRALRGRAGARALLLDAVFGILPLAVLVGGLTTMSWNAAVPVAVWWIVAGLLGCLAAVVTYRTLHVDTAV